MEYCLADIGLRFRPHLLRIAYEQGGGTSDNVLPIAAGIELMQASTLVIDDVLDKSTVRNGKPSVFAKWGAERAVVAGTVMSSAGLALISRSLGESSRLKNTLSVVALLLRTHTEIYVGQFMDLDSEADAEVSEEEYFETISRTTASFIGAPLVIGAMLWGAPNSLISTLREVGLKLGLAYQLRDDIIDIIGEPDLTGKPRAGDVYNRKMRLPVIHALACLRSKHKERLLELFQRQDGLTDSEVEEIILLLESAGSIKYATNETRQLCSEADAMTNMLDPRFELLGDRLRSISKLISCFDDGCD